MRPQTKIQCVLFLFFIEMWVTSLRRFLKDKTNLSESKMATKMAAQNRKVTGKPIQSKVLAIFHIIDNPLNNFQVKS